MTIFFSLQYGLDLFLPCKDGSQKDDLFRPIVLVNKLHMFVVVTNFQILPIFSIGFLASTRGLL